MDTLSGHFFTPRLRKALVIITLVTSGFGCTFSGDDISADPSYTLRFSADTVFFDTIFSEIPSITKRLRVYNDYDAALNIATIRMADPQTPYTLTVNGVEGTSFENTKILANDSILLLVKARISDQNSSTPYVVEDFIEFLTNGNEQRIPVLSWGQDANYLQDSVIACNTTWTAGKPYVLQDNVLVDSLCTLTIEPGTRIFSHVGSTLYVKGSLVVQGSATDRVVFMNDRFDDGYDLYPGQWGGILFLEGSKDNKIHYADIRNAEVGIWLGTPDDDDIADLVLENCIIENMTESAVLAFTSDLEMTNCLLNNAGQILFAGFAGGNYMLKHNTLANYGFGFFNTQPSLVVTDILTLADGSVLTGPVNLSVSNTIVWGSNADEISLITDGGEPFVVAMQNNLLRTTDDGYDNNGNILNIDPLFIDPPAFDYQLDTLSPAINSGANLGILIDLLDNPRSSPPDIGAYERQ